MLVRGVRMNDVLIVMLGGGVGAATRYLIANWAAEIYGTDFPYGTLIVNVVGCFIIGVIMTLVTEKVIVNPYWRLLTVTGFLGGLTTFSSFSYETLRLLGDGYILYGFYNIFANLILSLLATWGGMAIVKVI